MPAISQSNYNLDNIFSLYVKQNNRNARIKMHLYHRAINTADLPHTMTVIEKILPSVLSTECFNDQNLPFSQEIKRTEIGHLFEHILLEYLCQIKIAQGSKSAVFAGRTRWNWERDPRGLFHINVNCSAKDALIFSVALEKSIALMKNIFQPEVQPLTPTRRFSLRPRFLPSFALARVGLKNGKKFKFKLFR